MKRWIGATSNVTEPSMATCRCWRLQSWTDGSADYGILPVNMVRDEWDVESEGEPLSSKHKQNVEQKVQEIFGQNLWGSKHG